MRSELSAHLEANELTWVVEEARGVLVTAAPLHAATVATSTMVQVLPLVRLAPARVYRLIGSRSLDFIAVGVVNLAKRRAEHGNPIPRPALKRPLPRLNDGD